MEMFKGSSELLTKCLRQALNCSCLAALGGCNCAGRYREPRRVQAAFVQVVECTRVKV